jgi:pyruvate dehydrogenase E2 component (dihydrolipoamide acetyltransferase)
VLTVTLSVDHRPVDGVIAARWLAAFVASAERPVSMLV